MFFPEYIVWEFVRQASAVLSVVGRRKILFYFQFIYRWQILFHRTIRLAFHKQQGLSQTSGAINNIVECCYRWHQIFETELQFAVLIKVNTNQNRNAKIRQYAPIWQMTLYQNDLIKTLKIIVNASAA